MLLKTQKVTVVGNVAVKTIIMVSTSEATSRTQDNERIIWMASFEAENCTQVYLQCP